MSSFSQTFRHLLDSAAMIDPYTIAAIPPVAPVPWVNVIEGSSPPQNANPTPHTPSTTGIEFINSQRGKPKLVNEGYSYTYHKEREHLGIFLGDATKITVPIEKRASVVTPPH